MILAVEKNICEEIEIAVYSDSELTEEQKNHIENCESCKALLSQVSEMKSQFGTLAVPGIAQGSVADSVMNEIKNQRMAAAAPKFRWTHHLGTAAAIVIVLVAALILKNPSSTKPEEEKPAVDNSNSGIDQQFNDHEFKPAYTAEESQDESDEIADEIIGMARAKTTGRNSEDYVPDKSPIPLEASPSSAESPVQDDDTIDDATDDATDSVNSPSQEYSTFFADEPTETDGLLYTDTDSSNSGGYNQSADYEQVPSSGSGSGSSQPPAPTAPTVENEISEEETDSKDMFVPEGNQEVIQDNGSAENPQTSVPDEETASEPDSVTVTGSSIFNGITFLVGEEYFDYNVDLANEKLQSLYGNEYRLSKTKLREKNMTNADLLEFAPLITQSDFDLYKNALDIFE